MRLDDDVSEVEQKRQFHHAAYECYVFHEEGEYLTVLNQFVTGF